LGKESHARPAKSASCIAGIPDENMSTCVFSFLLETTVNSCPPASVPATLRETMPKITIKTDLPGPDGHEEELMEFICDVPGCPNIASSVLGCVPGLGFFSAVCEEHLPVKRQ